MRSGLLAINHCPTLRTDFGSRVLGLSFLEMATVATDRRPPAALIAFQGGGPTDGKRGA